MTIQEKKEAVRQFIVSAVPSVMDLKMGCRIQQRFSVIPYTTVISGIEEKSEGDKYVITTHGIATSEVYLERYKEHDNYIIEIIGRPITLADVLIAIKSLKAFHYNQEWWGKINALIFQWDLSQDFDHQSEEAYDFLWSLLCE